MKTITVIVPVFNEGENVDIIYGFEGCKFKEIEGATQLVTQVTLLEKNENSEKLVPSSNASLNTHNCYGWRKEVHLQL